MTDILRRCRFAPYLNGPTFALTTWYTGKVDWRGVDRIGYRLNMRSRGRTVTLFTGEDFAGSPMHAIDSDETIAALMGFLTLRPGDTYPDYFDEYTEAQLEYCAQHAEALACCVGDRFGW